jgi:hypothetical protein
LLSRSFLERYARAREEQADKLFREIIEIADDASGDYVTTSDGVGFYSEDVGTI